MRSKPFIDDCPGPKEVYALLDKGDNVVGMVGDRGLASRIVAGYSPERLVVRFVRVEFSDLDCVMKQFWEQLEEPYVPDRPGGEE